MANDGQGNFKRADHPGQLPDPNLVRVGDLNGDGIPDIFFGVGQGLCAFYPGLGGGQLAPSTLWHGGAGDIHRGASPTWTWTVT